MHVSGFALVSFSSKPLQIVESLARDGCAIVPNFLSPPVTQALREELNTLMEAGDLRPATIGRGGDNQLRASIRGDHIHWISAESASAEMHGCLQQFDELRRHLNQELFLGLFEFECHLSMYRPGERYARHLDQFKDDDRRRVSCVIYLNDSWSDADGGALRIFADGAHRDVVPHGGTLVIFLSQQFEHEVLPAHRERYSLTGWFKLRQP
jgi:SM-20-related protein